MYTATYHNNSKNHFIFLWRTREYKSGITITEGAVDPILLGQPRVLSWIIQTWMGSKRLLHPALDKPTVQHGLYRIVITGQRCF